jgi:hypothetical protein
MALQQAWIRSCISMCKVEVAWCFQEAQLQCTLPQGRTRTIATSCHQVCSVLRSLPRCSPVCLHSPGDELGACSFADYQGSYDQPCHVQGAAKASILFLPCTFCGSVYTCRRKRSWKHVCLTKQRLAFGATHRSLGVQHAGAWLAP